MVSISQMKERKATGSLEGKVAFITGASSGIGEATAIVMARAGAKVAVAARRTDRLRELVNKVGAERKGAEQDVMPITCDVSNKDQARDAVVRAAEKFGTMGI